MTLSCRQARQGAQIVWRQPQLMTFGRQKQLFEFSFIKIRWRGLNSGLWDVSIPRLRRLDVCKSNIQWVIFGVFKPTIFRVHWSMLYSSCIYVLHVLHWKETVCEASKQRVQLFAMQHQKRRIILSSSAEAEKRFIPAKSHATASRFEHIEDVVIRHFLELLKSGRNSFVLSDPVSLV